MERPGSRGSGGGKSKEPVRGEIAPKKISHIQFGLLSPNEMEKASEFRVFRSELFTMPQRNPAPDGPLDPRLGVSDKVSSCATCKRKLTECTGHFGHVRLALPVFHIGFFKHTQTLLACICKTCSRVLLSDEDRGRYLRAMRNPNADALRKGAMFKKIVDKCKKANTCFGCDAFNGKVKKLSGSTTLKLIHERYTARGPGMIEAQRFKEGLRFAMGGNKEVMQHVDKAQEDLSPLRVYELFKNVTDDDAEILWLNPKHGRPEHLLLHSLLVPPVPIRPSVAMEVGGGSNEDDLTTQLVEILVTNRSLQMLLSMGGRQQSVMEQWGFAQTQVSQFINGELPGQHRGEKKIRGLCQRLKGKSGRFRGNLSGKRVDFSGRTVISPDPNLGIDQVGVPFHVAKVMTYPERVSSSNRQRLQSLILNGPHKHPGANIIRPANEHEGGFTKSLHYADDKQRKKMAQELRVGDVVERHMVDDDVVLFNRQPSLHKLSIMAHRVKVMSWRTFRFNECVCAPYNADFDGDEMNMHLPQTEEARAEALCLMGVVHNLVTPRNGEPVVAATQDFLTGGYLLTQKDIFFTREAFCGLVAYLGDANEHIDMPPPAIFKPQRLWTGKQVVSLMVRPSRTSKVLVNLECEERNYSKGGQTFLCAKDGYVAFRNSELISGNLAKKTLGGSKGGLFYVLLRDHGALEAARCMNRLAKLCARFLGGHRGFSIGIDDVTPSPILLDLKASLLGTGFAKCDEQIKLYGTGRLPLKPGCDPLQSLESELNMVLGDIRSKCGEQALNKLPWHNSPRIMAECGSKGSDINISQMMAILGQQSVGGKRIENGFVKRTLPHFEPDSLFPEARGFVANSFYSGLSASEFFFHTMGGREGLVDTAVKTAETGYMARRLMKALEDLSLHYDGSVRNSEKTMIQLVYGDDGLDPAMMEDQTAALAFATTPSGVKAASNLNDRPVNFARLLMHHTNATKGPLDEPPLSPSEITSLAQATVESSKFQALLPKGRKFLDEVTGFAKEVAGNLRALCKGLMERGGMGDEEIDESMDDLVADIDAHAIRAKLLSMSVEERGAWVREVGEVKGGMAWRHSLQLAIDQLARLTRTQMHALLADAFTRYYRACVEPGEAVGAVGAQSISEPATQMTLKTFHFAGVASMNVTLGVPRLKEIINASKEISTPIITAELDNNKSETAARVAKALIEKTTIGQIAKHIKEVYRPNMACIEILLDMEAINKLHLKVDSYSVREAILRGSHRLSVLKALKDKDVLFDQHNPDKLTVLAPDLKEGRGGSAVPLGRRQYFVLQSLKAALPEVMVRGISSVARAIVNKPESNAKTLHSNKKDEQTYNLLIEGYGLADVMGTPGVDGRKATSNHIIEVERVLGIEAARSVIGNETLNIMQAYGIRIDTRHRMLLSDVMTFKGEVLGITRFGVAKMRESVLMLASFEKTTDHLFDAAVHGRTDAIVGVSECIIMGIPIPLGTGLFKLLRQGCELTSQATLYGKRQPLLGGSTYTCPTIKANKGGHR